MSDRLRDGQEKAYQIKIDATSGTNDNYSLNGQGIAFQCFKEKNIEEKKQLAGGGFANTYVCRFKNSRFLVVLKEPKRSDSHDHCEMMRNEYRKHLYAGAAHQNIVRALGKMEYEDGKNLGMVLEYVPEGTMENVISLWDGKKTRICIYSVHHIIAWMNDIVSALVYMHSNELAHLDLTANNILMPDNWRKAIIADFGISKLRGRRYPMEKSGKHNHHTECPSDYAAPEVKNGNGEYKSDVYSLAILLWKLVYRQHRAFPPERLNPLNRPECPDLIPELESILKNCWAHDPKNRWTSGVLYQKVHDFMENLFPDTNDKPRNEIIDRFDLKAPEWRSDYIDADPRGTRKSHKIHPRENSYAPRREEQRFEIRPEYLLQQYQQRNDQDDTNTYQSWKGDKRAANFPSNSSISVSRSDSSIATSSSSSTNFSQMMSSSESEMSGMSSYGEEEEEGEEGEEEEEEDDETIGSSEEITEEEDGKEEEMRRMNGGEKRNLKLPNLLNEQYYLRAFPILPQKTPTNPLVEFTVQHVNDLALNIAAIGNVRGIYLSLLTGMNERKSEHDSYLTRIFKPDRQKEVFLHMMKWNAKRDLLAALYEYKECKRFQLVTARVNFRPEQRDNQKKLLRKGGFRFEVSEFSIAGGDKCFPLDIEWTPTSEQDLAVCFNNAIYVFNEELHKLNGESRVPNGDHENSKEARLTIRRGMSARWGAGLPPPIICGWDESGRKFTYIYRKSRFTWDTQENRVTRRNMDDKITPTFSTVERLNGQNGKRWIVGETENGYEVWSFSHHKLHREYEALISLPDTPFPIKFKSLMNPIRDIQYVEPSPRPDGWKGGICIAINNQMGQQSQLFVWLKDRPIRPLDLKGEESAIRCLRFKRQPHYLAALTDRYLDVYKVDGEQLKITYRYDLLKISPFSGKVQWNDDGQKIVLHQKNPRTGMIGITALIRTKIDAPAPAVVVEKL